MGKISDQALIKQLKTGNPQEVDQALRHLHRQVYQQVARLLRKHLGTPDDTADVFQEALLTLYKLIKKEALAENVNVEAYLFTICKNLWFQQLRKRKEIVNFEEYLTDHPIPEVPLFQLMKKEEQNEINLLLRNMGEVCRKVLIDFYYHKIRMREIAERMGYSSEQVAKNQKSQCMKKLRALVLKSPVLKKENR